MTWKQYINPIERTHQLTPRADIRNADPHDTPLQYIPYYRSNTHWCTPPLPPASPLCQIFLFFHINIVYAAMCCVITNRLQFGIRCISGIYIIPRFLMPETRFDQVFWDVCKIFIQLVCNSPYICFNFKRSSCSEKMI